MSVLTSVLGAAALAAAVACDAPLAAQGAPGSIGGRIQRRLVRTPVEGARVSVVGSSLVTTTDSTGSFQLQGVTPGVRVLQVRAVGYEASTWIIQLAEGQQFRQDLELEPRPVEVEAVTVTARARDNWRTEAGFEERRSSGRGVFYTRAEIETRRPNTISDLLRNAPGVLITCRGMGGCTITLGRTIGRNCRPEFYLDGFIATFATGPNFPVNQIRGVEVYRDAAEVPVEFLRPNLRCGVIAIWTVEPGDRLGHE